MGGYLSHIRYVDIKKGRKVFPFPTKSNPSQHAKNVLDQRETRKLVGFTAITIRGVLEGDIFKGGVGGNRWKMN